MIAEVDFLRLQSNLKNYRFFSMEYIDYSDVSDYQIVIENDNIVLLYGYHNEAKCYEYHWAANSADDIINAIDMDLQCLITFVPHEWIETFEQAGFVVRNAWHDYFMDSLETITMLEDAEFLNNDECEEASEVTMSCKGQSRGFTGQTPKWIRDWLGSSGEDSTETDVSNRAILIERNSKKEIVGIACTGTYAHESEKGAIVWIREVAVKPDYQRRGIARKLITQALAYGKSFGAKRAFLAADECNAHAIHLYVSIGFKASNDKSQIDMIKD
jgi:GNAT superfamily N-acetyltransferase